MENEEIMQEIKLLREQQEKGVRFAAVEFLEVRAMLETIIFLQRIGLAQMIDEPPGPAPGVRDERIEEILALSRGKHSSSVREALERIGVRVVDDDRFPRPDDSSQ